MVKTYSDLYLEARRLFMAQEDANTASLLARNLLCHVTGKSQEEVITQLTSRFINGLVYGLAGNCGVEMPQAETLPGLLAVLEEKGCIKAAEVEGKWQLTSDYLLFARNFLLYDSLVLLEAFELTGENRMGASLELIFCAGMYDNISFSMSPEGFEIATLSGADLRTRIKETLDCPSFTAQA